MNTSLQKLVAGVVGLPRHLPGVLAAWDSYDDDLREEYAEQVPWLIRSAREALLRESTRLAERGEPCLPGSQVAAMQQSVTTAIACLITMGDVIEKRMGFRPEQLLSGITIAGIVDPRSGKQACSPTYELPVAA